MRKSQSETGIRPPPRLLHAARILAGLTQGELAARAGVHRTLISRYEAGTSPMRTDNIDKMVDALRASGVRFLNPTGEIGMGIASVTDPVETIGRSE